MSKLCLLVIQPNHSRRMELQRMRTGLYRESGWTSALAFEPVIPLAVFHRTIPKSGFAKLISGGAPGASSTARAPRGPRASSTPYSSRTPRLPALSFLPAQVQERPQPQVSEAARPAVREPRRFRALREGRSLYLPLESDSVWRLLRQMAAEAHAETNAERETPIAPYPGIFLCAEEGPPEISPLALTSDERATADTHASGEGHLRAQGRQLNLGSGSGTPWRSYKLALYGLETGPGTERGGPWWDGCRWWREWELALRNLPGTERGVTR